MNWCLLLGLLLLAIAPGASVGADTATKTAHVGFLRAEAPDELFAPFRDGLRELGYVVSVREAWRTAKSAHGPWRLSKTPALALALPARYFARLGLPSLAS